MASPRASGSSTAVGQDAPADIRLDSIVLDVAFHPTRDVVASATIDGEVAVHSYSSSAANGRLLTFNHHKKSCRAIHFNKDGSLLFSVSKDKSIKAVDLNEGKIVYKMLQAHDSPIYSLLVIDDYLLATGDDEGLFKVWDYRRATAIMEQKSMEEYISSMTINDEKKILLATSGEGTLTAFNVRAKRMELQSELFDSEFLSAVIVKRGDKVVVGTGEGALNIFNWGQWGNISDRFPGHPTSIDTIASITDSIICTGSADGIIRAVNILPNRFIGVVGEHNGFPVESLSVSRDERLLASCSHDQCIKFWNLSNLSEQVVSDKKKAKLKTKNKQLASSRNPDDFFADLET